MLLRFTLYILLLPLIVLTTHGTICLLLTYIHAFGLAWLLFDSPSTGDGDSLYKLRHVLFNLEIPPRTLWFNMGYWEETTQTYSEACARLVEKVVTSMQLRRNTRILDVGYGCGDSCFLLADQYNCQVMGVTNESEQWKVSCSRLTTQYPQLEDRIQLIHGSATDIHHLFKDQPLFDHIVSIDSAYHYATRWDFFNAALSQLIPGGSIGLYDLAATQLADSNIILKYACQHILGIPPANLVTMNEYKERMVAMGYKDVHLEALDQDQIFGGLSRFIKQQYQQAARWDVLPPVGNRVFLHITMWLFGLMSRKKWLQPVIVIARKP